MADSGLETVALAIRDLVVRHVKPLAAAIRPPEVLIVISFNGNAGMAIVTSSVGNPYAAAGAPVSIKSKADLVTGMSVVGVPTGPKEYYVVGYY